MATDTPVPERRKPGRPKGTPKTGGRKKGGLNRVTREVRDWAKSIFEDPKVQQRTLEMAQEGKLPPGVFTELLHYAFGKPKETHELTGLDGGPVETITRIERVILDDHSAD